MTQTLDRLVDSRTMRRADDLRVDLVVLHVFEIEDYVPGNEIHCDCWVSWPLQPRANDPGQGLRGKSEAAVEQTQTSEPVHALLTQTDLADNLVHPK